MLYVGLLLLFPPLRDATGRCQQILSLVQQSRAVLLLGWRIPGNSHVENAPDWCRKRYHQVEISKDQQKLIFHDSLILTPSTPLLYLSCILLKISGSKAFLQVFEKKLLRSFISKLISVAVRRRRYLRNTFSVSTKRHAAEKCKTIFSLSLF